MLVGTKFLHQQCPCACTSNAAASPTNAQAVPNQVKSNQARPDQSRVYPPPTAAVAAPQSDSISSPNGSDTAAVEVAGYLLAKLGPTEESRNTSANQIRTLFDQNWVSAEGEAKTAEQVAKILKAIIDFAFSAGGITFAYI